MTLKPDWRTIVKKAWSVRLMVLGAVLSGAEVALPLLSPDALPPGYLAALSALASAAAFFARLVAQRNIE